MKISTLLLFWCMAGAPAAAPAQINPPEPAWATVTIPYSDLKALWETQAQARQTAEVVEARPPVEAMLLSSEYKLIVAGNHAVIEASYRGRSLTGSWHVVPLLGGDVRLSQAGLEQNGILWRDNHYCLLTEGKGDWNVQLQFALASPADWTGGLRLRPGAASLNHIRISSVPDGKAVRIQGLAPTEAENESVLYHLPPGIDEIVLSLEGDLSPGPPLPSQWDLQGDVLVRHQEGRLIYQSRVHARASTGSGLSMELLLPANAATIDVRGDDLIEKHIGSRKDGRRPVRLAWKTRDVLDRMVDVSYAVPQSTLSTHWVLRAPEVADGGEARTLFVILPVEGLEFTGANLKRSVESRRLPEWLRAAAGSTDFHTVEHGPQYELQADWLPRIQTAQAMVSRAEFQSKLVSDGALLVNAAFHVQHDAPLNWRVRLPDVDEILTCQINGRQVQPVRRSAREIEFALGLPEKQTTQVTFSYAARLSAFDPVSGRIGLELPRTDLFIHELAWLLTMPDGYETTAMEGNVQIAPALPSGENRGPDTRNVIRLKKELVRDESPRAEIYYQRRGLMETESP